VDDGVRDFAIMRTVVDPPKNSGRRARISWLADC
jgi:hypothetical protein